MKNSGLKVFVMILGVIPVICANGQSFVSPENIVYEFISPYPGSSYHNINTRLVCRHGEPLDISLLLENPDLLQVSGEVSGEHDVEIWLATDGKTLQVDPLEDFQTGEVVNVILSGLRIYGEESVLPALEFAFTTSTLEPTAYHHDILLEEWLADNPDETSGDRDYPTITQLINVDPAPGNIFMHTTGTQKYIAILDSAGSPEPLWSDESGLNGNDFKPNGNNKLTYFNRQDFNWLMMDEFIMVIDTLEMLNGYSCDDHECIVLSNEHYLLQSYDPQIVNMSVYIPGGNPNCLVYGLVIQEIDENEDLVMQWRSWDFLLPNENNHLNLTAAELDLWHGNSIEIDLDNNLLFSLRNIDNILKVDRETGDIIWRMGSGVYNDFNFTNDDGFTYQHDARRLANGHITVFDNGNYNNPQVSRALEYELDEVNMTATLVWEFIHPDNLFAPSMGNCRKLPGGNMFINWGNVLNDNWGARVTEVNPEGEIVLEYAFPQNFNTYRSFKQDWFFDDSIIGCSDPEATNYNPWLPIINNESCIYPQDNDGDGFSAEDGDCDDTNNGIFPGAGEILNNGIDEDCSGADLVDMDNDGVPLPDDCDDNDLNTYPGAVDIPYNGIDEDCSGSDLVDVDNDGVQYPEDCDDENNNIYPGNVEVPYNGVDDDCMNGDLTDVDEDGFEVDADCDDNDNGIFPGAIEIPYNDIDEDCLDGDLTDVDNDGVSYPDDCDDNDDSIFPGAEEIIDDEIDQDCDGSDLTDIPTLEAGKIALYPNPVTDVFVIEFNCLQPPSWILVFDDLGKLVYKSQVSGLRNEVECDSWNRGLYTLQLTGDVQAHFRIMIN